MIFQQLALFPHMDVFNNIAYGLKVKKLPKADIRRQVHEMLELVQLGDYGRRAVSQLSGGQAQRVAIARALINRPEVLLLDEPLSALDMQLRLDMQRELKRIQREFGGTFIFVTHDQNEAMNMSDRIGVMRAGKLLQYAAPDEIYERPADSFVAKFIGDTNLLATTVLEQVSNGTRVECFGHSLLVKTSEETSVVKVGAGHSLSIRNEYIRLGEEANLCLNKLDGRVVEAVYGGANIRYTIQIAEGFQVQSSVLHQRGASRFSPGSQFGLALIRRTRSCYPNQCCKIRYRRKEYESDWGSDRESVFIQKSPVDYPVAASAACSGPDGHRVSGWFAHLWQVQL